MAKFANSAFQDGGLNYLLTNGTRILLLSDYTFGDSYAVVTGNAIASYTVDGADYTLSDEAANSRRITVGAQTGNNATADSGPTPDLHIAITNGTDTVILVTDETTDQVVTNGNPVAIPSFHYQVGQPA